MSPRTRTRRAAGVTTVQIPRQRGRRRGAQPFVVVVPEQPSLTREALGLVGGALWKGRLTLAPTGITVLACIVTAVLYVIAPWSGLVLSPLAVAPAVWFGIVQRRRPARGSTRAWRIALSVFATVTFAWAALAAGFGPLTGPLAVVWLFIWLTAQTVWPFVRRTR
ncbi:hypothetical protein PGH47_29025 [Streptomyces sp. HUAS 31]|uniref:hypothetical protein n=1 Tax=Streptomyces sp. HUAS 31 TaxID=3020055 RepID=UPI00230540B3|nr:hypothetical protein [Streptomyces sp. HUAS 31]WCD99489.1 hypothetical protein PGH47_29025 [Streptomyces sp. HUAS 31]